MAIDERSRHALYLGLVRLLGEEDATTLMEHLPPVGWADVATRHDLAALEQRLDLRFEAMDVRLESLEARMLGTFRGELVTAITTQTRSILFTLVFTLIGTMLTLTALVFAAARLA